MNGRRSQGGFTLLELLVAVAIFATLAIMAYGGLDAVGQTSEATRVQGERLRAVQTAFGLLERDLAQAVARPVRDEFGDRSPALLANARDGTLLSLTHAGWRNPAEQLRSNLQRVRYELDGTELVRSYWFGLDRAPGEEPVRVVLMDEVERIELRWLDGAGSWQDAWPPLSGDGDDSILPAAAEIVIELADWGEIRRVVVMPG